MPGVKPKRPATTSASPLPHSASRSPEAFGGQDSIDPRDTRTVLGICLSAIDNEAPAGTRGYGVYRM